MYKIPLIKLYDLYVYNKKLILYNIYELEITRVTLKNLSHNYQYSILLINKLTSSIKYIIKMYYERPIERVRIITFKTLIL